MERFLRSDPTKAFVPAKGHFQNFWTHMPKNTAIRAVQRKVKKTFPSLCFNKWLNFHSSTKSFAAFEFYVLFNFGLRVMCSFFNQYAFRWLPSYRRRRHAYWGGHSSRLSSRRCRFFYIEEREQHPPQPEGQQVCSHSDVNWLMIQRKGKIHWPISMAGFLKISSGQFHLSVSFSSVRLRKNGSVKLSENDGETKKGQRLIEKEAMETGQVRVLHPTRMTQACFWREIELVSGMCSVFNNRWSSQCSSSTCGPWAGDMVFGSSYFTSSRTLPSSVRTCGWVTGPTIQ